MPLESTKFPICNYTGLTLTFWQLLGFQTYFPSLICMSWLHQILIVPIFYLLHYLKYVFPLLWKYFISLWILVLSLTNKSSFLLSSSTLFSSSVSSLFPFFYNSNVSNSFFHNLSNYYLSTELATNFSCKTISITILFSSSPLSPLFTLFISKK